MRRILFILIFLTAIACFAAGTYASTYTIPEALEKNISASLKQIGFKKVTFKSITRKPEAVIFNDISLDSKSFSGIESIAIKYSVWSYFWSGGKAQSIAIRKLQLTGEMAEDLSFKIAGWKDDKNFLKILTHLPAKTIYIEDTTLNLLDPNLGGIEIQYNGRIHQNDENEIEITGSVYSKQKTLEFEARLAGSINQSGHLAIQAKSDNLHIETEKLKIRRANLQTDFLIFPNSPMQVSVESNAGSILWHNLPMRDANITLEKNENTFQLFAEAHLSGAQETEFSAQIDFLKDGLDFDSTIYPSTLDSLVKTIKKSGYIDESTSIPQFILNVKKPTITLTGHKNYNDRNLNGSFTLSSVEPDFEISGDFKEEESKKGMIAGKFSLPPSSIVLFSDPPQEEGLPSQKELVSSKETQNNNRIRIETIGQYAIDTTQPIPQLAWIFKNRLEKGTLEYGQLKINNLRGEALFDSRKKTAAENESKLTFDLPLGSGQISTSTMTIGFLPEDGNVIRDIQVPLYGGMVQTGPIAFTNEKPPQNLTLQVSDIDLTSFVNALKINSLYMTGRMGGLVPLENENGKLIFKKALLQSQQSGVIQMPEDIAMNLFPANDAQSILIRNELKNYHYEFFEIRMDGPVDGSIMFSVIARGFNPTNTLQPGTVELNFQLEAKLSNMLKNMIALSKN